MLHVSRNESAVSSALLRHMYAGYKGSTLLTQDVSYLDSNPDATMKVGFSEEIEQINRVYNNKRQARNITRYRCRLLRPEALFGLV